MTNEILLAKFNPVNAGNLSAEDTEILRNLTDAEIDLLADAYPNQPTRRAYLRLYDKNVKENAQFYNLSTWQNLRNNRKFSGKKNLIAWEMFVPGILAQPTRQAKTNSATSSASPRKVVVDLTAKEAADQLREATKKTEPKTSPRKKKADKSTADSGESTPDDQQFGDGGTE